MKRILIFLGLVAFSSFNVQTAWAAGEWGVDRPGNDYRNFNLSTDSPSACESQCGKENKCKAWTFVRPGVQGPSARCWLKTAVPPKKKDNCCVSGVKKISVTGSFEPATDRPGLDYRSFWLAKPKPVLCQQACTSEAKCRAWTIVKPGIQGPKAKCWLKTGVPFARKDNCCVSGVK